MRTGQTSWPGKRIGHLTVEEKTDGRKNGYIIWRCRCDCGNEVLLDTRALQRETITDCGCITRVRPRQKDMTGERYGKLVCLYPEEKRSKSGGTIWRCRCDCGKECSVPRAQLVNGYTLSCGCLSHPPLKDYVGKKFGELTVLSYAGKRRGQHYWHCRCECGNTCDVGQTKLQNGVSVSCGCIRERKRKETMKFDDGTCVRMLEDMLSGKLRSSNTSGYTGVTWQPKIKKWRAKIVFKGKSYSLGLYKEKEEAIEARKRGELMFREFVDSYYAGVKKDSEEGS